MARFPSSLDRGRRCGCGDGTCFACSSQATRQQTDHPSSNRYRGLMEFVGHRLNGTIVKVHKVTGDIEIDFYVFEHKRSYKIKTHKIYLTRSFEYLYHTISEGMRLWFTIAYSHDTDEFWAKELSYNAEVAYRDPTRSNSSYRTPTPKIKLIARKDVY